MRKTVYVFYLPFAIALLLLSARILDADSARKLSEASSGDESSMAILSIGNGYVVVDVDENSGDFEQGADPGGAASYDDITFGYDFGPPSTEWVMFYVDGFIAKNEGDSIDYHDDWLLGWTEDASYDISMPVSDEHYLNMTDSTIYIIWHNWHGVEIREELTPVSLGSVPGALEQIKCRVVMKPIDGSCHQLGTAVYYDTQLNGHDGAPISTAFGYTGICEMFFAPTIPPVWRAYEIGYPPGPGELITIGILTGYEATMPDIFWYGAWREGLSDWLGLGGLWGFSHDLGWNTTPATGIWNLMASSADDFHDDTAVLVKWIERSVCPPDSAVFVTYYGIEGDIEEDVYFTHTPPVITPACDEIIPNPVSLQSMIINGGTIDASNVCLTLDLSGSLLTYFGGDSNPMCFGTIAGYGGTQMVSWDVDIPPSAYGTNQCYDIILSYDGGTDSSATFCIDIPFPYISPVAIASNDDPYCVGDTVNLFGEPDLMSSYEWSGPDGFSSNMQNPTVPDADISNSGTYTLVVVDSNGCADTTTTGVIITVCECPPAVVWIECPIPCWSFSSCSTQVMIFGIMDTTGIPIDTMRVYFTVINNHSDGTADTAYISESSVILDFSAWSDSVTATIFGSWADGDSILISLDSLYNANNCLTIP